MPVLASAGYRAVAVTARGYEPSSQPTNANYQLTALAADVPAWLDSLGENSAHLIGHDWGSAIASAAATATPERVASLCMVSVPHGGRFARVAMTSLRQLWLSRYIFFFQRRGAPERRLRERDLAYVDTLWQRWSPGWEYPFSATAAVKLQLSAPGVIEAALAHYRQGADSSTPLGKASRALAKLPVPVPTLALHGCQDGCVAATVFRRATRTEDFPAGVTLRTLPNCGHFPQREQPQQFNGSVLDWLQLQASGGSHAR